jgi:hypothetical protein
LCGNPRSQLNNNDEEINTSFCFSIFHFELHYVKLYVKIRYNSHLRFTLHHSQKSTWTAAAAVKSSYSEIVSKPRLLQALTLKMTCFVYLGALKNHKRSVLLCLFARYDTKQTSDNNATWIAFFKTDNNVNCYNDI